MTYPRAASSNYDDFSGLRPEAREPGARRKKLMGYLTAANDLRQSYFSQDDAGTGSRDAGYESGLDGPGAFPDAAVVRSGNEEMVLFPSYARRHMKRKTAPPPALAGQMSEQEYWRREWEKHQDDNAIVDVDVRGWIYTPHRGPSTRKQRLVIGMARQLVGLPAPPTTGGAGETYGSGASSRASSPQRSKQEQEIIRREADNLVRKGEQEERYARRGAFSEAVHGADDRDSLYDYSSRSNSRASSPDGGAKRLSQISTASSTDGDSYPPIKPLTKRSTTMSTLPSKMTHEELKTANHHLLNRLKPFMANPLANSPISAFFYNESSSRSHTVYTDASGHFSCRAALDFIPTHVRVLAGEKLSATEEVIVTSPTGVSMISDIDDTVKHSAIKDGAREIFRNAFVRELGDLTIDGVREWYNTMHDMGVKLHYVSNSPWQMYPVLTSFFKMAHLPKGSFHLKQYSGMFQGIFEPVAERKKASLDKIMRDFPDRKFILVGDSGEADLEVYTDTALDNPGRVIGIFIRDVTTPVKSGYFDSSNGFGGGMRGHSKGRNGDHLEMSKRLARPEDIRDDDKDLRAAIAASLADMEEETRKAKHDSLSQGYFARPASPKGTPEAPPRRSSNRAWTHSPVVASPEDDLIDFSEPPPAEPLLAPPARQTPARGKTNGSLHLKPSPSPPPKPETLRSPSPGPSPAAPSQDNTGKTPPPRPRKPSSAVKAPSPQQVEQWSARPPVPSLATNMSQAKPSPLSQVTQQSPDTPKERPPLPQRRTILKGLTASHKGLAAPTPRQSEMPPPHPHRPNPLSDTPRALSTLSSSTTRTASSTSTATIKAPHQPPAPPPRLRNLPSYSTTARKANNRLSGGWDDGSGGSLPGSPGEAGMSRKEFLWNQRWARAKGICDRNGITLRSWRIGADVADVCVRLAEAAMREIERQEKGK